MTCSTELAELQGESPKQELMHTDTLSTLRWSRTHTLAGRDDAEDLFSAGLQGMLVKTLKMSRKQVQSR